MTPQDQNFLQMHTQSLYIDLYFGYRELLGFRGMKNNHI